MSLSEIAAIDVGTYDLLSTDVFDTVLLRDTSSQTARFGEIAGEVARELDKHGLPSVDPRTLTALRATVHQLAYRAVAVERPLGDAQLTEMHAIQARLLGGGEQLETILKEADLAIDRRRLSANRPLLELLERLAAAGKRIIAVSDTYYSAADLERLFAEIVGRHPIARFYASSEIGLTKHAGALFAEVANRENVALPRILHFGDDARADVIQARAAGCRAVHLKRPAAMVLARKASAGFALLQHGLYSS